MFLLKLWALRPFFARVFFLSTDTCCAWGASGEEGLDLLVALDGLTSFSLSFLPAIIFQSWDVLTSLLGLPSPSFFAFLFYSSLSFDPLFSVFFRDSQEGIESLVFPL